jgi:hypothetical protein
VEQVPTLLVNDEKFRFQQIWPVPLIISL